ncbi:MAG: PilZ domain-containing protein [Acidobacteria bacterium]|nr:PilZ domain-containing protein [Acidobacteriota bacterium]
MSQSLDIAHEQLPEQMRANRRQHARYADRLPVMLRGVGTDGSAFEVETRLENHSAGGFYVRLADQCMAQGAQLFATIKFATITPLGIQPPQVAVNGVVVRTELHLEGGCGVAVEFTNHRFI